MALSGVRGSSRIDRHDHSEFLRSVPPATEVVLLDRDGVIVSFNEAWERFCLENGGRLSDAGVGVSYLDVCRASAGDSGADQVEAAIRSALKGDLPAPVTVSVPCHSPDTWRWFDTLISTRRDDDGQCIGAAVTISLARSVPFSTRDGRRVAAVPSPVSASIHRSRVRHVPEDPDVVPATDRSERLGDDFATVVLDLVPIGILILDDEDLILRVSRHGDVMFGYEHDGLAGVSIQRVLPELPARAFRRTDFAMTPLATVRTTSAPEVVRGIRRDGSSIPLVARVGPVALSRGAGTVVLVHESSDSASEQIAELHDTIRSVGEHLDDVIGRLFDGGMRIASSLSRLPRGSESADGLGVALGELDRAAKDVRVAAARCLVGEDTSRFRTDPHS